MDEISHTGKPVAADFVTIKKRVATSPTNLIGF
jgi:hypothetical protein